MGWFNDVSKCAVTAILIYREAVVLTDAARVALSKLLGSTHDVDEHQGKRRGSCSSFASVNHELVVKAEV